MSETSNMKEGQKIAYTETNKHYVSTIFLGDDWAKGAFKDQRFETMAFSKDGDVDVEPTAKRTATIEAAMAEHERVLCRIRDREHQQNQPDPRDARIAELEAALREAISYVADGYDHLPEASALILRAYSLLDDDKT